MLIFVASLQKSTTMAMIKCRECGQLISDKAARCPRCGCPSMRMSEQTQYQRYDTPPPARNDHGGGNRPNNNLLYAIIAGLLVIIAGGAFFWYNSSKQEQKIQQMMDQVAKTEENTPTKGEEAAQQTPESTVQEAKQEVKQEAKQEVQVVQPAPKPQPAATYTPPRSYSLSGILNGDYVTFELYPNGSSSVSGVFTNYTINVAFNVSGTLTDSKMSLRSVNHGKWRFRASRHGGSYRGTCTNGSSTYSFEVQ